MSPRRLLLALALAAVAVPAHARADATLTVTDIPLRSERALASVSPAGGFHFVGLHWKGSGEVEARVQRPNGTWSPWLEVDADAAPDPGTAEARRLRGWRKGEGLWVGKARRLEIRTHGSVRAARALTVLSPVTRVPLRQLLSTVAPTVVPRSAWGADERIVRGAPTFAPAVRLAIVHHTAGRNAYTREEAPAIVRAIQLYHVKGNGWNDIGYNALVDRFGTVYEGRAGGIERNVVGAHAKGFNTGAFGVALLGEFTSTPPTAAAQTALVATLAWRLDLAHVDPLATVASVSAGNERYAVGTPLFLRAVSSHRDTGSTACPGDRLYPLLLPLARRVAAAGLPKIYDPVVTPGASPTFAARLSSPAPWTVRILDRDGAEVAALPGQGSVVAATWTPTGVASGTYTWRIESGNATPASGTVTVAGSVAVPAIEGLAADVGVIAPNGDGLLDAVTLTFRLPVGAAVSATVLDSTGTAVAELEPARWRRAGTHRLVFDGLGLPDGVYAVRLVARVAGGTEVFATVPVAISRTLISAALGSPWLSRNGDGREDVLSLRFALALPAGVQVRILRPDGRWVATPFAGTVEPGERVIEWDGAKRVGVIRDGGYVVSLEVTDGVATTRATWPFVADGAPPKLALLSTAPLRLRVSEPATLRLVLNGRPRTVAVARAGVVTLGVAGGLRTLTGFAEDGAGNVSAALRLP